MNKQGEPADKAGDTKPQLTPAKQDEFTLSAFVMRNLGDRSYEKRKAAALEIEHLVLQLNEAKDSEKIDKIITILKKNFIESTQANQRKGGLIGLAATAIGLMKDTHLFLDKVLPPVLSLLRDQESRVRYYACEALYNITKVVRGHMLMFINEIFDGLCTLYADPEVDVKNGAQLLDNLIKDVVTETESFDVEKFIPLLKERILVKDACIRQLLIGWITVLDSVPDIDMLEFLPEFLAGLFAMLSDSSKDIRQAADGALAEFLREIADQPTVSFQAMVPILVDQCQRPDAPSIARLTALSWLFEFIQIGKQQLIPMYATILGAILHTTASSEEEIRREAEKANESLMELVISTNQEFDIKDMLDKLQSQLQNKWDPTRLACLRWISTLLRKMPAKLLEYLELLFPVLLRTLSDPSDEVVSLGLEVLARISWNKKDIEMVLNRVIRNLSSDRKLLETRGSTIIRQLSELLGGDDIYRAMARILQTEEDLDFASLMVQTLNLILLTASELFELRSLLRQGLASEQCRDLFVTLYKSWCHNPVATLSLCLLARAYELASALVTQLAEIEVTVVFMMQLDKLIQLLESPIFTHLRLELLESRRHPFLLKCMYGLLMLLPQSSAFHHLKTRLDSVSSFAGLKFIPETEWSAEPASTSSTGKPLPPTPGSAPAGRRLDEKEKALVQALQHAHQQQQERQQQQQQQQQEKSKLNFGELLNLFKQRQQKHQAMRKEVLRQTCLQNEKKVKGDDPRPGT